MNTDRPQLNVPLKGIDVMIEILTAIIIILLFVLTFVEYSGISEKVPLHFDASGKPDRYGDKSSLILLPIIGLALTTLMYIFSKYPHLHNYMVNITEENALKNYRFSSRILRFTSLSIAVLFASIQFVIIQMGKGQDINLGPWFLPIVVIISILFPISIFTYQYKMNKK